MGRRFKYEHKKIEFPKWEDNYFLDNVKDAFPILVSIYDGKIPYVRCVAYPTLINMYEQLCKGVCKELSALHKDELKLPEDMYEKGHRFRVFADTIDDYIPIAASKDGYSTVIYNIRRMEQMYNTTRYSGDATFEEFQSDFRRFENQLFRMMNGLAIEYEKAYEEEEKIL